MKLKYLTLYGFKSFPLRTKLQFSSGISAVVGPNGCGKSNVIDAIRWVLGEQSPAVLRAKSMEDLIYSGDGGKKVNFAEVALGFDAHGPLPLTELEGVTEIEIRRRLTRGGDSEYSINGKTCRLKDIHYLFMDTGAGTRAYSIVDQGQISRFVDMDAEERRDILDEAAGIARYKARRIETSRRLTQTRENLDRLNDIIIEVEAQKKKLSEQAEQTAKYLELRSEQERLEKALYAYEWGELQKVIQSLEEEVKDVSGRIASIEADRNILLVDSEQISLAMLKKEEAIEAVRMELAQKEDELRRLVELKNNQERLKFTEEHRLKTSRADIDDISHRKERLANKISGIDEEITRLKQVLSELESKILREEQEVNSLKEGMKSLKDTLERYRGELVGSHAVYARLDSQRRSQRAQLERLQSKLRGMETEKIRIEKESNLKKTELDAVKSRLEQIAQQLSLLQQREQVLKQSIDDITVELKALGHNRQAFHTKLSHIRAKLKALQELEAAGVGFGDATKAILKQKDIKKMGVVADMLQVRSGCEDKMETIFSETLQAIMVESLQDLEQIKAVIANQKVGRARVFVRERLPQKISYDSNEMQNDITITGHLEASIRYFLSQWETVEDIKTGLDSVCAGKSKYLITKNRDIVTPWGEVIIHGRDSGAGIIARRAEIASLKTDEEKGSSEYELLISQERVKQAELDGLQKELGGLRKQKEQLTQEQTGLLRNLERMQAQTEAQTERMERIDLDMETVRAEIMDLEIALEEIEQNLEKITKKKAAAEAVIKEKEGEVRQREDVLTRKQKSLEADRISFAEKKMRLTSLEQELAGAAERLKSMDREMESLKRGMVDASKRIEEIQKALTNTTGQLSTEEAAISRLKSSLSELQNDYYTHRDRLKEIQTKADALQSNLQGLQKSLHAKDVEMVALKERAQAISQRARELFQASIDEHVAEWLFDGFDSGASRKRLKVLNQEINAIGAVNLTAIEEFQKLEERYKFLMEQKQDLLNSINDIEKAIAQINRTCRQRLKETLEVINERLKEVFPVLFEGGEATLAFTEHQDVLEAGVDYLIKLPGKRIQHLSLLSGGEKALAALALIFAIFLMKPSPFCLLDEVDAPLDGANTQRFTQLVKRIAHQSQVLLITHNQRVMEAADTLYGVTMEERGVSKLVSVRLGSERG